MRLQEDCTGLAVHIGQTAVLGFFQAVTQAADGGDAQGAGQDGGMAIAGAAHGDETQDLGLIQPDGLGGSQIVSSRDTMFVEDEDYMACVLDTLAGERYSAEYAVWAAGEQFAAMEDAYMQARAADIRDVTQRLLNNLMGVVEGGIDSDVHGVGLKHHGGFVAGL